MIQGIVAATIIFCSVSVAPNGQTTYWFPETSGACRPLSENKSARGITCKFGEMPSADLTYCERIQ